MHAAPQCACLSPCQPRLPFPAHHAPRIGPHSKSSASQCPDPPPSASLPQLATLPDWHCHIGSAPVRDKITPPLLRRSSGSLTKRLYGPRTDTRAYSRQQLYVQYVRRTSRARVRRACRESSGFPLDIVRTMVYTIGMKRRSTVFSLEGRAMTKYYATYVMADSPQSRHVASFANRAARDAFTRSGSALAKCIRRRAVSRDQARRTAALAGCHLCRLALQQVEPVLA